LYSTIIAGGVCALAQWTGNVNQEPVKAPATTQETAPAPVPPPTCDIAEKRAFQMKLAGERKS
jgi:hypothetical protein